MAIPLWQPGALYQPGDIVLPITQPAPTATQVANGDFSSGSTGWDFIGGAGYVSDRGYSGNGSVRLPGNVADGLALNQTELVVPVGQQLTARAMIEQGASIKGATRGWVEVHWFDGDDQLLRVDKGNEVDDGSGGAWKQSSVTATAPAGASYARAGIALWSVADHSHPIWGDNLTVSGTFAGLPSGLAYKAVQAAAGFSAGTEPAWPPVLGQTVIDNEVTWEAIATTRVEWTAEPLYVSGDTEPEWPTAVGGFVRDGSVNWRAVSRRVEDPNCPNTRIVAIAASKVFCADKDIVRYSATVNPLDWSSAEDAGYLPTGLQNYGSNPVEAMGLYRGNLVVFNAEAFQLWQVDEDPASMALLDALPMGSSHHHAIAPVSNDLFFLASQGVRTLGIAASSTNFQAGDVGMPIDPLVVERMGGQVAPMGLFNPAAGQYWLMFPRAGQGPLVGPTISGSAPDGDVQEAYPGYAYTVTPGSAPIRRIRVIDGTLPNGIDLDEATGALSQGTPNLANRYAFRLQAEDTNGMVGYLDDAITIAGTAILPPQLSDWRYLQVDATDPTDYSAPDFDDSGWATGAAPFGGWESNWGPENIPSGAPDAFNYAPDYDSRFAALFGTTWQTHTRLWLRRKLVLAEAPTTDLTVVLYIEDHCVVYVNGSVLLSTPVNHDGGTGQTFTVPAASLSAGENVIALRCNDENDGPGVSAVYVDLIIEVSE